MGLDFDLFGEAFIVVAQDGDNFVAAEVIGQLAAFGLSILRSMVPESSTRSSLSCGQVRREAMPSHL
jgi:hypothetical protein